MQQIALQPVPSQKFTIVLAGQNTQIAVYLLGTHLFVDVNVGGADISIAVVARNLVPLVPTVYTGLGSPFALVYLTAGESVAAFGGN
jgi:hypothetical protein